MLIVLLVVQLLLSACGSSLLPTPTPINSFEKVQVGVDATLPPFEMDGYTADEAIGFDVDLINAIAERQGMDIELIKVGNNQVLPFVANCRLDVGISAIAIMDAYKNQVDFSDVYYSTDQAVVVKQGNITIQGRDQLAGMLVETQIGTLSEAELAQIPGVQAKITNSFTRAIQDLAGGDIDAVIADRPRAQKFVDIQRNDLKIVGDGFGQVDYGIVTCKSQPELLNQINAGLAAVKADGTLDKLAQTWKLTVTP